MSSKSRYRIGEIVRIKATGEKVKIVNYGGKIQGADAWYTRNTSGNVIWYWESSLKPYKPSRTGKYRDSRGKFISKGYVEYLYEKWRYYTRRIYGRFYQ